MAKIYINSDYYIDLIYKSNEVDIDVLDKNECYISILTCHKLFQINKISVPNTKINEFLNYFHLVDFDKSILNPSFIGPTHDLEDNIQLQSAVEANCDYFLTNDKALLKLKFFGKMRIVETI